MKYILIPFFLFVCLSAKAQDYLSVDKYAKSVSFSTDYKSKAVELTKPFNTDAEKVRSIFSWIVSNLGYDMKLKEKYERVKTTSISGRDEADLARQRKKMIDGYVSRLLKTRKGVCQDYSYLFQKMCAEVGIEAAFVPGYGRFTTDEIGVVHKRSNHAWNAVKINGQWELIDISWTITMEMKDRGFFFVDPAVFILSHYPENPKWQLLSKPYSERQFANKAFMFAGWLDYGVTHVYPDKGIISKSEGSVDFVLKGNPGDYPIMIAINRKPQKIDYEKRGDEYYFSVDVSKIRGELCIALLDGDKVDPVVAMQVK